MARPDAGAALEAGGFEAFYSDSYERFVRIAYLMVGSRARAEELVQDTFVKVHYRYDEIEQPVAYARRALMNACYSEHRRRKLEDQRLRAAGDRVIDLGADEMSDALAELPDRQRAAIVLRYYADLSERDIAAALDCRPGTVGPLISRGLTKLREALA